MSKISDTWRKRKKKRKKKVRELVLMRGES